jgi:hypothetical protein
MSMRTVALVPVLCLGIVAAERSMTGQGFPPSTGGRPDAPVDGVLTTSDGRPLAGVHVSGSLRVGAPFRSDTTRSDADGRFHLDHPGTVLHFYRDDLRPHSLVIAAADTRVRVSLEAATDNLVTMACETAAKPGREIAGSYAGFNISDQSMRVSGGEIDVDYRRFLIRLGHSESVLELWFGPYAMSGVPGDDMFIDSSVFRERQVVAAKGDIVGLDSWGTLKNGRRWRQTSIVSEGAIYRSATSQEAESFDRIINSVCVKGL